MLPPAAAVSQAIAAAIGTAEPVTAGDSTTAELRVLYRDSEHSLIWFDRAMPRPVLDSLFDALEHADRHGLDPSSYDVAKLRRAQRELDTLSAPTAGQLADLDVGASRGALRYLRAVSVGRVSPEGQGYKLVPAQSGLDYPALVRSASERGRFGTVVDSVEPQYPVYRRLETALARYRGLAARGDGDSVVIAGDRLNEGDTSTVVPALARRLMLTGDLTSTDSVGSIYDSAIVAGVKRFQARHSLAADGVIGSGTLAELNTPIADRVEQLELALERLRWFPRVAPGRMVMVNIPFFELHAYDQTLSDPLFEMEVVVGKTGRDGRYQTPIFADSIRYLVFRPFWFVPESIAVNEIIPEARKDSTYLTNHSYEIVPKWSDSVAALEPTPERFDSVDAGELYIRQRPGPINSLGRVKFLFPNSGDIYLHDTPERNLFRNPRRSFSHGCVRISRPAEMAVWLLDNERKWSMKAVEKAMAADHPETVALPHKVPIVLFYMTATVDPDGTVRFADDPYGYDAKLAAALGGGAGITRLASSSP